MAKVKGDMTWEQMQKLDNDLFMAELDRQLFKREYFVCYKCNKNYKKLGWLKRHLKVKHL